MINEDVKLPKGTKHHAVLLSYFQSSDGARLAVSDLMDEGLSEQDFALLSLNPLGDSGRTDVLEHVAEPFAGPGNSASDDTEDAADRESTIGAGISTISPDDDVSAVQEMDDSETAAEDMMYPPANHSIGDEESRDVALAARTGFFDTTLPDETPTKLAELSVVEIDLPGLGALVGEGSFGSSILDKVFKDHDTSLAWLAARINAKPGESGIDIGHKGAVLAIDVNVSTPNPDRIEEVMLNRGAYWVRLL